MTEQMGIIRRPGYGARDFNGEVGLWFDVYISNTVASLQCLFDDDADEVLRNVYDVKNLEGKPCMVEVDGNTMKFKRLISAGAR